MQNTLNWHTHRRVTEHGARQLEHGGMANWSNKAGAGYELDMNGHCGMAAQEGEKNGQNMEAKREQL
eukprot:15341925-Alexandrium_andersonii.AAC.1